MAARSWIEKLADTTPPLIGPSVRTIDGHPPGVPSLVPSVGQVDAFVRHLAAGQGRDVASMRRDMAVENGVTVVCPAATGRHMRTVTQAAFQRMAMGEAPEAVTPFWRVLDSASATVRSLPGAAEFVRERRRAEGLDF